MSYTREQALAVMQRVLLGELAEDSDEFRAAVQAMPELGEQLRAMRGVQQALDRPFPDDAAEIAAEAAREATDADRRQVAEALVSRMRRGWPRVLLVAAMLAVTIFVVQWRPWSKPTGVLGGDLSVTLIERGDGFGFDGLPDITIGDRYRVTLELDGEPFASEQFASPTFSLPASWLTARDRAQRADLIVEADGRVARLHWKP